MKNALIVNAVMVNNGDAGLVLVLADALKKAGFDVTIATFNAAFSSLRYPTQRFCQDVVGSLWMGPFKLFAYFVVPLFFFFSPCYRKADVLIGAPGGYINSYYGFRWKLYVYKWAKRFGKRTILYSQSIGPLTPGDKRLLRRYSRYIDVMVVRDSLSRSVAIDAGVARERLILTDDAIFLREPASQSINSHARKSACVSVRDWKHDGRRSDRYFQIISRFVRTLIDEGYSVDFLSTCQGIPGYVDDARTARRILDSIAGSQDQLSVLDEYLTLPDLENRIRRYDVVVGTRLHMCLLSLLNGVPAFNISYEAKGVECYKYLDAEAWTVDYNDDPDIADQKLKAFLRNLPAIKSDFEAKVRERHLRAKESFGRVVALLEKER